MGKIDPVLRLLSMLLVFSMTLTVVIGLKSPEDGQTFTFLAGICTALLGMIGLLIKAPQHGPQDQSTTTSVTKTVTPPPEKL